MAVKPRPLEIFLMAIALAVICWGYYAITHGTECPTCKTAFTALPD
jgi:hypothetical protein